MLYFKPFSDNICKVSRFTFANAPERKYSSELDPGETFSGALVNISVSKMNHLYLLLVYPTKSAQLNLYNTCLKYCNVKKCHKSYWNQDTLQQPPVMHPQDVLYYHRRKLDWLSLFILHKSFTAVIHLLSCSCIQTFCLCIWNFLLALV